MSSNKCYNLWTSWNRWLKTSTVKLNIAGYYRYWAIFLFATTKPSALFRVCGCHINTKCVVMVSYWSLFWVKQIVKLLMFFFQADKLSYKILPIKFVFCECYCDRMRKCFVTTSPLMDFPKHFNFQPIIQKKRVRSAAYVTK